MVALIVAIALTLGVSAFCSLLEAFILSTSVSEVESLKRRHPHLGAMLERFKTGIDETSAAILTLNTVANTLGASIVGVLAGHEFDGTPNQRLALGLVTGGMVVGILFFSEIIPKNIGVAYRKELQIYLVHPIWLVRFCMWPFSTIAKYTIRLMLPKEETADTDDNSEEEEEIILLAEKRAQEGALTTSERDMISNALSLDDVHVSDLMTPRTVVTFLDESLTVGEVSAGFKVIPFARMPVYRESIDDVVGLVRRREIMQAYAEDHDNLTIGELMTDIPFVPETATALDALQLFLLKHQQLALVVDEFGSTAGVITMEDIVEHLLGREIYEDTDLAIDMRELARRRARRAPGTQPEPAPEQKES